MAEIGLAVAQTLFAALQCSELKEICSIWGYKSQLEKLNQTVTTIQNVLLDVGSRMELSHEQRGYVQQLKDVVYEADNLFDEFVTLLEMKELQGSIHKRDRFFKKVHLFFSSHKSNFSQAYRMFHKVKEIQNKLNAIVDNHRNFGLTIDYNPIYQRGEETCSYVVVDEIIGRDGAKKVVIDKLLESKDQGVSFLTVVGVGGLGKTALAQLVYNDENIQREFGDSMFWVCVADQDKQEFDVKAILSKILGQTSIDGYTLESMQHKFREKIGRKKYMLVLDDVWNEDREKWVDLQSFLNIGEEGSRVLVTTRSEETATMIGDDRHYTYKLEGLSSNDSWDLFKMVAFNEGNHHQKEFSEIGKTIVAKCFNIPLAIRVVGSLLYGQDISQWRLFAEIGLAEISKGENKIMSVLKLSYQSLETSLKSCFTYCAVFPKDYRIDRNMLVSLWMAQGYVVPIHGGQSIEDAAEKHFLVLLRRCFFQDVEKDRFGDVESVKIHDLMHDVAQQVAGKEIQHYSYEDGFVEDEVCHLSFVRHGFSEISSVKKKLRSCIQLYASRTAPVEPILEKFIYLRVLVLQDVDRDRSLESIGELLHLRYLEIRKGEFEALPSSITKLHNLQTLIVTRSHMRELPHDMSNLKKLRHLDISGNSLICMPPGMDRLTSLRVLTDFVVGKRDHPAGEQHDDGLKGLETCSNLTGRLCINIGEYYRSAEQPMNNVSYLSNLNHLKEVSINIDKECINADAVLKKLEPHPNIKGLTLRSHSITTIPWWREVKNNEANPLNLVHIDIRWCGELQTMPPFSRLPYLKSLLLSTLTKLEYVEETSSSSSYAEAKETPFFPSLESLSVTYALKLKGWFRGDRLAGVDACLSRGFPQVSILRIRKCDELASFPPCPSVEYLHCDNHGLIEQVVGRGNGTSCLNTLIIDESELKTLSEMSNVFRSCASSLWSLDVLNCCNLGSISEGLEHLTVLETLTIAENPQLNFSQEDDMLPWRSLHQSLHTLILDDLENMTSLPKGMQHLTSLRTLEIRRCPKLKTLPEWMTCLSSLRRIEIVRCGWLLKEDVERLVRRIAEKHNTSPSLLYI